MKNSKIKVLLEINEKTNKFEIIVELANKNKFIVGICNKLSHFEASICFKYWVLYFKTYNDRFITYDGDVIDCKTCKKILK